MWYCVLFDIFCRTLNQFFWGKVLLNRIWMIPGVNKTKIVMEYDFSKKQT